MEVWGSLIVAYLFIYLFKNLVVQLSKMEEHISYRMEKESALPSAKFISEVPACVKLMVATV